MEWARLKEALNIIQFQPPCYGQGQLLHQFAQNPTQPSLEICRFTTCHLIPSFTHILDLLHCLSL